MPTRGLGDLEFALVAPAFQRRFADAQGVGYGSRRVGSFRHFRVVCVLQARGLKRCRLEIGQVVGEKSSGSEAAPVPFPQSGP